MAIETFIWICILFMLGRNIFSLFFKILSLFKEKERKELKKSPAKLFTFIILNITAVAGIVCGISLIFQNSIFGFFLFIVVSGMMIYSYFVYAGICYEDKKWPMFGLCLIIILFTSIMAGLMSFYLATGVID